MKKPKKPKIRKLPKRPKASASLEVWERYEDRAQAVIKENRKRQSDYQKALKAFESAKKKKASLMEKIRSYKAI